MIPFYIKYVAISILLIIFYYLVLENQKNHHFKRFFLLLSLGFSLGIPFLEIPFGTYYVKASHLSLGTSNVESQVINEVPKFDVIQILTYLYFVVAGILVLKLVFQIGQILFNNRIAKNITFKTYNISLLEEKITAFSFLNRIYLNRQRFENNEIDDSILIHEQAHISQKHSFDILLIEILKALFWLNPAIYFFKNAIATNHEFLADEEVLKQKSPQDYQKLIYQEVTYNFLPLTQTFKRNNNTKKRFIMMNTNKNKSLTIRVLGSVLFTCGVAFFFAEKVKTPIVVNDSTLEKSNEKSSSINKNENLTENIAKEFPTTEKLTMQKVGDTIKKHDYYAPPPMADKSTDKSTADWPDKVAEYPGGMLELRQAIANEINLDKFDNVYGTLKANCLVNIDAKGNLVGMKVSGQNKVFSEEVERSLTKILQNTTWTPAQKDGKDVASFYRIPIVMEFDGHENVPPPPPPPPTPVKPKRTK
ncbi:M56 family metallopeptidase [Soonwooa sp.]|uniref:M56 family metallopeptidase n=1 Tax=Soonwooa sp. TaxID=1938592 RepID=UPI002621786D|nr:M56 family metallopeptidase [Soonwooa sp.]